MFGNNTARERLRLLTTSACVKEHSGRNCTEEFNICGRNPCATETVHPSWGGITMKVMNAPQIEGATTVNFTMTPAWTLL